MIVVCDTGARRPAHLPASIADRRSDECGAPGAELGSGPWERSRSFNLGNRDRHQYNSADAKLAPAATRTTPFGSSVAVWYARAVERLPVGDHVSAAGSYSSLAEVCTTKFKSA